MCFLLTYHYVLFLLLHFLYSCRCHLSINKNVSFCAKHMFCYKATESFILAVLSCLIFNGPVIISINLLYHHTTDAQHTQSVRYFQNWVFLRNFFNCRIYFCNIAVKENRTANLKKKKKKCIRKCNNFWAFMKTSYEKFL